MSTTIGIYNNKTGDILGQVHLNRPFWMILDKWFYKWSWEVVTEWCNKNNVPVNNVFIVPSN